MSYILTDFFMSPTMPFIGYRDLISIDSASSTLFADYVTNFERVAHYYPGDFRKTSDWKRTIDSVLSSHSNRSHVANVLSVQNRNFHCGIKTLANIDLLHNDNTLAVVTGQQVGLFTGPLYTIYKTITTIKLAEDLNSRFPDYQFVPIFWLEGEDHDYDEVSSIRIITRTNDLATFSYQLHDSSEKNVGAVGILEFKDSIEQLFRAVEEALPDTEFKPKVMRLFRTAYQPGMTFNRAFVHLMNDLLEDSGLIFIDPHDAELKKLLKPIFQREIQSTPKLCQLVIDQSAELEKTYHAQIKPKPINLFLFHNKGRYLIEPHAQGGFSLKGTRRLLSREELQQIIEQSPETLSPNVVLRPICQDWLLPTVAYVAGPSEIAYFAQLGPLYDEFGISHPLIYPRAGVTIVEEKVEKVLERFNLRVTDCFQEVELVKRKVAESLGDINLEELFGGTSVTVREALTRLQSELEKIDPTLKGSVETAIKKIDYQLDSLKQRTAAALARRHEIILRQVEKAVLHLYPQSTLQERTLNVLYFLNKYGLEFLRWLKTELVIDSFKHQIIKL
jgi:bacillithiol biosynthesis cysteine-adding enzyme BshC